MRKTYQNILRYYLFTFTFHFIDIVEFVLRSFKSSQIRLTKEQQEKEDKKKEKAEAHMYTALKV
jgi:hypothetical protein